MDIRVSVEEALGRHSAVRRIELIGSRSRGDATSFSDWDFQVITNDFPQVANDLPSLAATLRPMAKQWDRLSDHKCYMLVLKGPTKVDLLFDVKSEREPPWTVRAETLQAIDDHFWDWILWLLSKEAAGKDQVVRSELQKLYSHLLEPMGVSECPTDVARAVDYYAAAREAQERRHGEHVSRTLEQEMRRAFVRRRPDPH
jgi:hypothetical protein